MKIINGDWNGSHLPSKASELPNIFGLQVQLILITVNDFS